MIVDLERFVTVETPFWSELEGILARCEQDATLVLTINDVKHLHYLYQRASSDLVRLGAFPNEPCLRAQLESLVARAFAEIHEPCGRARRLSVGAWLTTTFPQTFRRRLAAFLVALGVTVGGALFGALVLWLDADATQTLLPFEHLHINPSERVQQEESSATGEIGAFAPQFSASLMTHNIRVTLFAMALGITFGAGTFVLLFYNGVIIGAVFCDYILAGQTKFVFGWLLPHGAIEIPAILIGAQAGLILGRALIGKGDSTFARDRFRAVADDVLTLVAGAALLLVWAGIVEAFFSQYHEPVVPYSLKIAVGALELLALVCYLSLSGKKGQNA